MLKGLLVLLGVTFTTGLLYGQATPPERHPGEIQVGAGYSFLHLDYSRDNPSAVTGFADYDFIPRLGLEGEIRGTPNSISEANYLIGPRVNFYYRGFRPYGKVLFGLGRFHAPDAASQDGSYGVLSLGGGIDYSINKKITLRLVDYEYQKWLNFPPRGLQPNVVTIGLAYRFK